MGALNFGQNESIFEEDYQDANATPSRGIGGFLQDTAVDLGKGALGLGEAAVGLANIVSGNLAGQALEAIGYQPKYTREILSSFYSDARKAANKNVEDASGFVDTTLAMIENPSSLFGNIAESSVGSFGISGVARSVAKKLLSDEAIRLGTGGVAKVLTKQEVTDFFKDPKNLSKIMTASAIGEGAQTTGQIQEQGRQAGREWSETVAPAVAAGVGTGAISLLSNKLAGKIGLGDTDMEATVAMTGMRTGKDLLTAGKDIAKSMFKEGVLEEMPQSTQEQIFTNLAMGKEWSEGVPEAAAQGLVAGAAQAGGMTAMSRGYDKLTSPKEYSDKDVINTASLLLADEAKMRSVDDSYFNRLVYELEEINKTAPSPEIEALLPKFKEEAARRDVPKAQFMVEKDVPVDLLNPKGGEENVFRKEEEAQTLLAENNQQPIQTYQSENNALPDGQTAPIEAVSTPVVAPPASSTDQVNIPALEAEVQAINEKERLKTATKQDLARKEEIYSILETTDEYKMPEGYGRYSGVLHPLRSGSLSTGLAIDDLQLTLKEYTDELIQSSDKEEQAILKTLIAGVNQEISYAKKGKPNGKRFEDIKRQQSPFVRETLKQLHEYATQTLTAEGYSNEQIIDAITDDERTAKVVRANVGLSKQDEVAYSSAAKGGIIDKAKGVLDSVAAKLGWRKMYHASIEGDWNMVEDRPIYLSEKKGVSRELMGTPEKEYYVNIPEDKIIDVPDGSTSFHTSGTSTILKEALRNKWEGQGYLAARGNISGDPNGNKELLIFHPVGKVKLADVTRDASGKVIPLAQRFNETSPDVRYNVSNKQEGKGPLNLTVAMVKNIFRGQEVTPLGNGWIHVKTKGGGEVIIKGVGVIDADSISLQIGYGNSILEKNEVITGKYQDGTIELRRDREGNLTLAHESIHFMEDMGILNKTDVALIKAKIKKLVTQGKFVPKNKEDIGSAEDRANYLGVILYNTTGETESIKTIVGKIRNFIEIVAKLVGIRTTNAVIKDVTTGKIYDNKVVKGTATESYNRGQTHLGMSREELMNELNANAIAQDKVKRQFGEHDGKDIRLAKELRSLREKYTQIKEAIGKADYNVEEDIKTEDYDEETVINEADGGKQYTPEETAEISKTLEKEFIETVFSKLQLPELVKIAKDADSRIKFKKWLGKNVLGRFTPSTHGIGVLNSLSYEQLMQTLAHEIGHLHDWLAAHGQTEGQIKKGGLLAKIAGFLDYRSTTLAEFFGSANGRLTNEDRDRLRKEATDLIRREGETEVHWKERTVPKFEERSVTADEVMQLFRGLAFEPKVVLDYIKRIDGHEMARIAKQAMKGVISSPISEMKSKVQIGEEVIREAIRTPNSTPFNKRVAKLYAEMIVKEVEARKLFEKKVIDKELKDWSQSWKPFDETENKSYTKYRYSADELYADAMSGLFNDPERLRKEAPTFFRAFFDYMNSREEFAKSYEEIQKVLKDPDAIGAMRDEEMAKMNKNDAEKKAEEDAKREEENKISRSQLIHTIRKWVDTKNIRYIEMVKKWEKIFGAVPDKYRIDYWMERVPNIDSEVHLFQWESNKIIQEAKSLGISLDDLSNFMTLQRAGHEAKRTEKATEEGGRQIASPLGIGGQAALGQLAYKQRQDPVKYANMERLAREFRENYKERVLKVLEKQEMIPSRLMRYMMENEYYVTFANNELENDLSTSYNIEGSSNDHVAKIYNQYGGVNEIKNTVIATIMKGTALIRAARFQETKSAIINSLTAMGEEPQKARRGGGKSGKEEIIKIPEGMGAIHLVEKVDEPDGEFHTRVTTYYIDKELAEVWNQNNDRADAIMRLGMMTKWFITKLFIQYNLPWIFANPIRDMIGTYKKTTGATIPMVLKAYKDTLHEAWKAGWDKMPQIEKDLLAQRLVPGDREWNRENGVHSLEEALALEHGFIKQKDGWAKDLKRAYTWMHSNGYDKYLILPPIGRGLTALGKAGERWGKFAGYKLQQRMQREHPENREYEGEMSLGHGVIQHSGTPNSGAEGQFTKLAEILFPFSRIAIQDMAGGIEAFHKDKASYALKTLTINILPKIIVAAAMAGALGPDWEEKTKKIPSYFRRMYSVVPMTDVDGQTVFLKIPQDYTGQAVGAIVDSILSRQWAGTLGTLGAVASYQPFNANPFITTIGDWLNYYANDKVPTNFYGNKIMTERESQAGGQYAAKALARATWNDFFGSLIYRIQGDGVEKTEPALKKYTNTAPINFIGKFLGVSDTGIAEESRLVVEGEKKKKAVQVIGIKKDILDKINKQDENITVNDLADYWTAAVTEGKIDPRKQPFRQFSADYMKLAIQKTGGPYIRAFEIAKSNDEKAALLANWKKELPVDKYEQVYDSLMKYQLLSKGALQQQAINEQNPEEDRVNELKKILIQRMVRRRREEDE